ncbi:MAG: hypothetical protein ACTSUE_18115, partial [Promethearchaeota archaeon]
MPETTMIVPEDLDQLRLKANLLKDEWVSEIERGLKHMQPVIRREFRVKGIFGFLADPLVSFGTEKYIKSARKIANKQLNIAMECAMEIIKDEHPAEVIDEYFEKFREYDILYRYAKKSHDKFELIVNSLKNEFILRIEDTVRLLSAKPLEGKNGFSSVADVYKSAYKYNVNSAKRAQEEQLKYIKERVELIRNDKTL